MAANTTIWTTRCPGPNALSIAVARSELRAELEARGATIQSLATSTDPAVRQSHFIQSQPYFIRQGGNTPPLVSASRGKRVRILGLAYIGSNEGLYALPQSGIRSANDIRGKRISLPRQVNDPIDFWRATVLHGVGHSLEALGLSDEDISWVDVEIDRTYVERSTSSTDSKKTLWDANFMLGHQREEAAALLRGDVDLIYSTGSIAALMAGFTGAVKVFDLSSSVPPEERPSNGTPQIFTTTEDLLDDHPDFVDLIVEHVVRSGIWARDNEADAKRIIGIETGVPEELVDTAWTSAAHQRLEISLDDDKVRTLEKQIEFLDQQGFLEGRLDLSKLIAGGPLKKALEKIAKVDSARVVETA